MIPISGGVRVYIATRPVDFRKGHDGLAAVVQETLKLDPFCGAVFVFRSKRADRLKLLVWDGTGLVLAHKRLENSTFAWAMALSAAVLVHAGVAAIILQQPSPSGAKSPGFAGIEISLGPAGGAPIDVTSPAVEAPVTETVTAAEAPTEPPLQEAMDETETAAPAESPAVGTTEAETSEPQPTKQEEIEPPLMEEAKPTEPSADAAPKEEIAARPVIMSPPPTPKPRMPEPRRREVTPEATSEPASEPMKAQPQGKAPIAGPSAGQTATIAPSAPDAGKAGTQASPNNAGSANDVPGGGVSGETDNYIALLQAWLEKHKEYPRRAQLRRQEGTALLYLIMDRDGRVLDYRIEQSSGHDLLDREVVKMIKRAQPLPRMPDDMRQARLELVVPVQFFLR